MTKGYHHLTYEQRCQIQVLKESGKSLTEIAAIIGVHKSTISRELKRNGGKKNYEYRIAHRKAKDRRHHAPNKKMTPELVKLIEEKIKLKWSPEQIAGWLKKHGKGNVSHETIYKYIWNNKKRGGTLYTHLRHRGKKYNKRGKSTAGRGCIPGRIDIKERPEIVEEKSRVGDWELDTIIGARQKGVLVSIVDRKTKLTRLRKVSSKATQEVSRAIVNALTPQQTKTLTADNGKEFANHQWISKTLGAPVYFATPYHSWERGLNEHTNGLVRQYFPKKLSLDKLTDEEVFAVEQALNTRPRKILGFETPLEMFERLTGA